MVFTTGFDSAEDAKLKEQEPSAKQKRKAPERDLLWIIAVGAIEVIMGCASVAVSSASYVITQQIIGSDSCFFTKIGQGIWSGCLLFITGLLGLTVKYHPTVFMYSVNIAFGAVVSLLYLPGILLSSTACDDKDHVEILRTLHLIMVIHAMLASLSTIAHSILCCSSIYDLTNEEYMDQAYYEEDEDEDSDEDSTTKKELKSVPYRFVPPQGEDARHPHILSGYMMKKKAQETV